MKKPFTFLIFFGLFWTAMVMSFDGFLGVSMIHQIRARNFSKTTGQITHSEVTTDNNSEDTTYGVDIRYNYSVDDHVFEGTRFRYGAGSSSDCGWAYGAVAQHPVGSTVEVFYDPRTPSESLLSPGLDSSDFMILAFMTPFNMAMLGFWVGGLVALHARLSNSPNGGVAVIRDGQQLRVRLPRCPVITAGLATTGIVGFVAVFVILFSGGFHPNETLSKAALIVAYSAGILVSFSEWCRIRSGSADLLVDQSNGMVTLPRTFGRKKRIQIACSEIHKITVETIEHKDSEGGPSSYTYAPTLHIAGKEGAAGKLAEWLSRAKADAFVKWIRSEIGVSKARQS